MRQQWRERRLGLILGAGISRDFGLPDLGKLVDRIAADEMVQGSELIKERISASSSRDDEQKSLGSGRLSNVSKAQILYHYFRQKSDPPFPIQGSAAITERYLRGEWHKIIRKHLYESYNSKNLQRHPYIRSFLPIIRKSHLTVTYNFDDCIEKLLLETNSDKDNRGYETVWDTRLQFKRNDTIIYHPNGFLPSNPAERASDELVFLEDTFADQLINMMAGHYSTLLHHMSKTTCLLLGLSLEDSGLKHMLHQSAMLNSGHCHYYVEYIDKRPVLGTSKYFQAKKAAHFGVYNLITLFLTNAEIDALGALIAMDETDFRDLCKEYDVVYKYVYYVTGGPGAGKTTAIAHLRCVGVLDEWPEERDPKLNQEPSNLTPMEIAELDQWIARQFKKKNTDIQGRLEGIFVVDRTPMDPVSFTPKEKYPQKAKLLLDTITPNLATQTIESGHILFLKGTVDELAQRLAIRGSTKPEAEIVRRQEQLEELLLEGIRGGTVTSVDTHLRTVTEVVKRIAEVVFMEPYMPHDLQAQLRVIVEGSRASRKQ